MEDSPSEPSRDTVDPSFVLWLQRASPSALCLGVVLLVILYTVVLGLWRLYFSPLAKFPGSRLAIATGWHQCYYEVVRKGQYSFKIKEMHEQYGEARSTFTRHQIMINTTLGPIIRINPWELSIKDPDWYSRIYVSGSVRRTNIDIRQRAGLGLDSKSTSGAAPNLGALVTCVRRSSVD
jgi:hypothetical protein